MPQAFLNKVWHVSASKGLKYRRNMAGKTAVYNGEEVILEETDWYLLDLFRLWWRYGISFIRLQMWVEEIMEKFMRWVRFPEILNIAVLCKASWVSDWMHLWCS